MEKVFKEAVREIYPSLQFMPRIYNGQLNFANRERGYRHLTVTERYLYILTQLQRLKKKNRATRASNQGLKLVMCVDCGTLHRKIVSVSVRLSLELGEDPKPCAICPTCLKEQYFKCSICHEYHSNYRKHSGVFDAKVHKKMSRGDGTKDIPSKYFKPLCNNCMELHVCRCFHCGLYLRESDWLDISEVVQRPPVEMRVYNDGRVEQRSRGFQRVRLFDDDREGEPAATGYRLVTRPGAVLCSHCHTEHYMRCDRCGDVMYRFQSHRDAGGNRICAQCRDDDRIIHAHNYRPKKFRFKASKLQQDRPRVDTLHYGIELEVENIGVDREGKHKYLMNREAMATRALDFMGREDIYVVHDGSLTRSPDGGIEIVTHPMTWEYYRENIDRWDKLLMNLRKWGGQAWRPGTCGLHYHMTKGAFNTFQLYKFTDFFYKKSAQNFVTAIAGRHGHERYARFNKTDMTPEGVKRTAKRKNNASGDRYAAVNLTNATTVELRMFRGSLEPLLFHKNMEFLQALFEFSRDTKPSDMVASKFVDYVLAQGSRFKCLIEFIKQDKTIAKWYPHIVVAINKKGV
jgi:hypothetical protein